MIYHRWGINNTGGSTGGSTGGTVSVQETTVLNVALNQIINVPTNGMEPTILVFEQGLQDQSSIFSDFTSAEISDFSGDRTYTITDGTTRLVKQKIVNETLNGALGAGKVYEATLDMTQYKKVEGVVI